MIKHLLRFVALLALILLVGYSVAPTSQTAVTTTTLSSAVSSTSAQAVQVASATNVDAGGLLYVGQEAMQVISVNGTTARVMRGALGTRPSAHASGATVYVAANAQKSGIFRGDQPLGGTCTRASYAFLPQINVDSGHVVDCLAPGGQKLPTGVWTRIRPVNEHNAGSASFNNAHVAGRFTVREEFDQGYFVHQDDMTAKSVTDTEVNIVHGSRLGIISYREELGKTASSWVIDDGKLDIKADNTTDDEGVEIIFGGVGTNTTEGVIVAGTSGACFTASITLTDISGTDQLLIGWRQNETFVDAAAYAGYAVWHSIGVTASDGSITSKSEVSGATATDDSNVNMADGETRLFRSCVSSAGVFSAFYSDNGGSTFNAITMTNSGQTATAGIQMWPYLSYLAAGTDGPNPLINWVEISPAP